VVGHNINHEGRALQVALMDKCALFGFEETGDAGVESTDGEEVDQEEVEEEVTRLREDNKVHASEDA